MATREKKARSVTADSPTPSLGSAHSSSNSNISAIATATTTNTGSTVGAGGSVTNSGGGDGSGGARCSSAPTTPTSSRKGVAATVGGTSNVNSGNSVSGGSSGGGVPAAGGSVSGSGGSTASSTTRASLSRVKSKQLLPNDDSSVDDTVPVSGSEGSTSIHTTPSRTTRGGSSIARDDPVGVDANASVPSAVTARDKEDMTLATAGTSKDQTKSPAIGARRAASVAAASIKGSQTVVSAPAKQTSIANNRKHRAVALKRTTLLKRKGKKIIGKPILGKKSAARRKLAAAVAATSVGRGKTSSVRTAVMGGKKEAVLSGASAKEEEFLSTPSLRNGKPRNSDSPVGKRKAVGLAAQAARKREINKSPEQMASVEAEIKIERRRSCSVMKFSEDSETGGFEIKRELLDFESRNKMLDKMAEAFNDRKLGGAVSPSVASSSGGGTLRRSMRQRKSTARDKDDFVTPRGKGAVGSMVDIKVEPAESGVEPPEGAESELDTMQTAPLTIDTTDVGPSKGSPLRSDGAGSSVDGSVAGASVGEELVEKDPSLSPELISEGVSELSVKECYSEPAFLENNLGIEKDPKLGEIVQGRFRCDKVSDDGGACEEKDEEKGQVNACDGGGGEEEHVQESVSTKEDAKDEEVPIVVALEASVDTANGTVENELVKEKQDEDMQDSMEDDPRNVGEEQPPVEVEEAIGGDDAKEESVVDLKELDKGEESEGKQEDEATEEEMEVVVELDSGKADSDSETASLIATTLAKDEEEVEEEEDVTMVEETAEEEVLKADTPTSLAAVLDPPETPTVVEIVVEEDCEETSQTEEKQSDDGLETKTGGEVVATVTETDADKSGTTPLVTVALSPNSGHGGVGKTKSESNGVTIGGGESSTPNNQLTARPPKANSAAVPIVNTTTPKGKPASGASGGVATGSASSISTSSGKETKSKSRSGKEKSKDDEKTREEKLRQEKLRVEEKVREEKLRAEMRLKEELQQQQKQKNEEEAMVLENGVAEEVSTIGVTGPSQVDIISPVPTEHPNVEKELKTDPAGTATTLISLEGLNQSAITIVKKESDTITAGTEMVQSPNAEMEVLPIAADGTTGSSLQPAVVVLTAKDENLANESVESPLQIISKSEQAAAAVTITPSPKAADGGVDSSNKSSPVSSSSSPNIIKIENGSNSNGGNAASTTDAAKKNCVTELSDGDKPGSLVAQLPADKAATTTTKSSVEKEEPATTAGPLLLDESDDAAKQKESHLKHLGLLTIRAACEEKQRRAEQKPSTSSSSSNNDLLQDGVGGGGVGGGSSSGEGWLAAAISQSNAGNNGAGGSGGSAGGGRNGNKSTRGSRDEYTVSMKTVLKSGSSGSGRGEKRKQQRMPLKMTFQKGKGKGSSGASGGGGGGGSGMGGRDSSNCSGTSSNGSAAGSASPYVTDGGNNGDTAFYTIHSNELDHHSSNSSDGHLHRDSASGGRKAHSRSHTTDGVNLPEAIGDTSATEKAIQKSLVIPEKASSFNVHPERLCQDQCFYCGGKFGLYDTPCHIAAIKSSERQQKILLADSKITLDSCLCDACFRHVDRKANCTLQKKKNSSGGPQQSSSSPSGTTSTTTPSTVSPIVIKMTTNKDGSTSIAGHQHHSQPMVIDDGSGGGGKVREICAVRQCTAHAMQSLRRKWVLKMKRKIGKQLDINLEQAARATTENISICNRHYEQISHLMICAMCTRPLQRNHVYHMYNNIPQLEVLIQEQGLTIRLSSSELVVCKLCRHYANLLFKPPDPISPKAQFIKNYNRRLQNLRHRGTKEQDEQDVVVQSVETTMGVLNDASPPNQSTEGIVISDGDDEEDEDEDVEEYPDSHQQTAQHYQVVGDLLSINSVGDNSVSLRRRGSSRKSPDVSIIENNSVALVSDRLGEITIIPTTRASSSTNHHNQHHHQSSQQRDDNLNMTKVLKSNPQISMRELFPGEEELGVHVNIPLGTASMRTPEGWTKITSTIQYDDNTRILWEELQKPYGNQSSFLRHLILLEKYFRNGDLVLSPQAKTNATTYSEAVQNRLRSFDNVPTPSSPPALASLTPVMSTVVSPDGQLDKTSSIFQQFSSGTVTIVPTSKVRPKGTSAHAINSGSGGNGSSNNSSEGSPASAAPVSLLKSNNQRLNITCSSNSERATMNSLKRKLSNEGKATGSGTGSSFGASLVVATSAPAHSGGVVAKVVKLDEQKATPTVPPELISIQRRSSIPVTTIPTSSLMAPTTPAATIAPPQPKQQQSLLQSAQSLQQQSSLTQAKRSPAATTVVSLGGSTSTATVPNANASTSSAASSAPTNDRDVIQMPEQLTETEREETTVKPWRPTLLPIAPGVTESLKFGPLYQTADGRLLPMLVQVMSGGKPYHISIDDYNRMCIMRREKLIQQQHNINQSTTAAVATSAAAAAKRQLGQARPTTSTASTSCTVVSSAPPALRLAVPSVEATLSHNPATKITPCTGTGSGTRLVQIPNQILEQNSFIPIAGGSSSRFGGSSTNLTMQKNSSLTATMTTSINNNNSLAKTASLSQANTVKPLTLPNSTTVYPMLISANSISLPSASSASSSASSGGSAAATLGLMFSQASSIGRSNTTSLVLTQPQHTGSLIGTNCNVVSVSSNPLDQLLKGGKHVTQSQLQAFAAAAAANGSASNALIDNSPAQLLSKIPKSLTVITQQKQRSTSRVSSHEDQNSA